MNGIKIDQIREYLKNDETNFKELIKHFGELYNAEVALNKQMKKFENLINLLGSDEKIIEMNGKIRRMFELVAKAFHTINTERESYVIKIKIILGQSLKK